MLTPIFFTAIDDALQVGKERDQLHWTSSQPQVGDRVPMGGDRLWEIIAIDSYLGDAGGLLVAHVHPMDVAVPAREEWYCVKCFAKRPLTAPTLHIKPDGSLHQTGCNFTGALPEVRRLLTAFNVAAHTTGHQPWGIESFDTYSRVNPEATFMAIYLAHVVPVDLADVEGAIVLEPELITASVG